MLAIFNTIGQLVGGLCRDHTIAKGLSLKFATSGGLELEAQWAGRQSEGVRAALLMVYRRKGSVHRIDVGVAGGSQSYSVSSALYRSVRLAEETSDVADYACLLAQSLLRTSVAGSGWVLPKHRLIS